MKRIHSDSLKKHKLLLKFLQSLTKDELTELHEITLGTKSAHLKKDQLIDNITEKETSIERLLRRQCIPGIHYPSVFPFLFIAVDTLRCFMFQEGLGDSLELSKRELVEALLNYCGSNTKLSKKPKFNKAKAIH